MPRRRAAVAPAPVEEDVFEEIDELEDPDEEVGSEDDIEELEEAPAPVAKKRGRPAAKKAAAPVAKTDPTDDQFDSNWLASYVTEETGVEYDARGIRMLLRKLAKDGHLAREVGTDRTRYVFPKGVNDPTVRAVLRMVKSGEAAAVKNEGLEAVKSRRKPAEPPAAPPKKTTVAKKAAPAAAKATPTTRRRRAPAQ